MICIGSKSTKLLHFEKCIYGSKIEDPIKFENLVEAVKQGFLLDKCCERMRDRLFNKGFIIKGPKADIEFFSNKHYYPEDKIIS